MLCYSCSCSIQNQCCQCPLPILLYRMEILSDSDFEWRCFKSESCVYNTGLLYVPHATTEIWPAKYCFTHPTLSTVIFPTVSKQMGSCHKRWNLLIHLSTCIIMYDGVCNLLYCVILCYIDILRMCNVFSFRIWTYTMPWINMYLLYIYISGVLT